MNRKRLVRFVLILITLWALLIGMVYIANLRYRDRAILLLKNYLDEYIQTEIQVKKNNIHISVLKNFPYASIDLYDILIKSANGPDYSQMKYEGKDTLLFARRLSLQFNLMSILTKNYELNKIDIEHAILNILMDPYEKANYLILKSQADESKKTVFTLNLRKIKLNDVKARYIDYHSGINFNGNLTNTSVSGVLSGDNFQFKLSLESNESGLEVQHTSYFQNQSILLNTEISKKEQSYQINYSDVNFSGLKLAVSGQWIPDKKYYSFSIESRGATLQNLKQSLLSPYFAKISYIPEHGNIKLIGSISGNRQMKSPSVAVSFEIKNAFVRNISKHLNISNLYMKGNYTNGIRQSNATSVLSIDSLSARSGKTEVYIRGAIENFYSPHISVRMRGAIELDNLSSLESIKQRFELSGIVHTGIFAEGYIHSLNSLNPSDLSNLSLHGELSFEDIYIRTLINPLPPASISGKIKINDFHSLGLENVVIKTGSTTLNVNGTVINMPVFPFDVGLIPTYQCNVTSSELHIEDFLRKQPENVVPNEPVKESFPDSIIVSANFNAEKLYFGKFGATEVNGNIQYQSKKIHISGLSMKSQEGNILSDINIIQDKDFITINSNATIQNADIKNLFYSFNNFGQTVIVSDNMAGRLSGVVHLSASWDHYLNPVYNRLSLQSEIQINKGEIVNYEPLLGLSRFIKVDELKHIYFDQLNTKINVEQETVYISQTDINSSAINMKGSGEHHFDNSYVYRLQIQLSDVLWNKAKKKKPENTEFGYVVDDGLNRTTIPLKIKGKNTNFEVSYDLHTAGNNFLDKFRIEKKTVHSLFRSDSSLHNQPVNSQVEWNDDDNAPSKAQTPKQTNKTEDYSVDWKDE